MPMVSPLYDGAELLVAADCSAFAYGAFHEKFIKDRVVLVGCPKLDATDYSEKLSHIFAENSVSGVTVVRMNVPCCGGLERAVKTAVLSSGKDLPCRITVMSTVGNIVE